MVSGMRQIGKIKCLETIKTENENADLIILFHGYGADAYDLQTLSEVIPLKNEKNWLFPQGPLEVPIGPGWTGRAWWNIDMEAIQTMAQRGEHRDMTNEHPDGLKKIRPQILDLVEKSGTPWERVILGGFSQGAMLATDIYLHAPTTPKGLIVFSGQVLCQEEWKPLIAKHKGKKFFMSHGTQDPILAFKGAQKLETLLCQNGMKGQLLSFAGVHEIPPMVILAARDYLNSL